MDEQVSDDDVELSSRMLEERPQAFREQSANQLKESKTTLPEEPEATNIPKQKYEKKVKRNSMIKQVCIFFVVVAVVVSLVFYVVKLRREKHVSISNPEITSTTQQSFPELDADEIANLTKERILTGTPIEQIVTNEAFKDERNQQQDTTVDNQPVAAFEVPTFDIGGGVVSRGKTERDVAQSQPRFRSFLGFDRSQRQSEDNMTENELNDGNLGVYGRGQGRQLQKIKPRITLAMRTQMTDAEINALITQGDASTGSMSQAQKVLSGIETMKKKSTRRSKKSKS